MKKPAIYSLIFNAVGALIGVIVVGYVVYSAFRIETEPSCAQTYPAPHRFSLTSSGGALLSPIQLQARAGLREWGLTENAKAVADASVSGGAALQVELANSAAEVSGERATNGLSFRWRPSGVRTAMSACLSYEVWLPKDFAFNNGGLLPGIFGGFSAAAAARADDETRFGTRIGWKADEKGDLYVAQAGSGYLEILQQGFRLARERWTRIDQEIVLNAPGERNGRARLWVDGRLKAEARKLELRSDGNESIAGVLADIGYLRNPTKPGMLRLSPFEVSWR